MNEHGGDGRSRLTAMALGLAVALAVGGCQDEKSSRTADELAAVRKERDDLKRKLDASRQRAESEAAKAEARHEGELASSAQEARALGGQLDRVRDRLGAAMAAAGRTTHLAADDRTRVADLADEFVAVFRELRAQYASLEVTCRDLTAEVRKLEDNIRRMAAQARPAPAGTPAPGPGPSGPVRPAPTSRPETAPAEP